MAVVSKNCIVLIGFVAGIVSVTRLHGLSVYGLGLCPSRFYCEHRTVPFTAMLER